MNKKNIYALVIIFGLLVQSVFAIKIPTGDNIRIQDTKEEGDAIVEAVIGGTEPPLITTPLGKLKATVGSTLYFYPSGALAKICLTEEGQRIETPIGTMILANVFYSTQEDTYCEFYESGSPKVLYCKEDYSYAGEFNLKIGNYTYSPNYSRSKLRPIYFYDSNDCNDLRVKELYTDYIYENGRTVYSMIYTNKTGTFDIAIGQETIEFHENGLIKTAKLYKSSESPIIIDDNEVYAEAGKTISFYSDGSIAEFTSADLCITTLNGTKLKMPAGYRIALWENGSIKICTISNDLIYNSKILHSALDGKTECWFNQDGTLKGYYSDRGMANELYEDGSIKSIVRMNYYDEWELEYSRDRYGHSYYLMSPIYNSSNTARYYIQDKNDQIASVIVDDQGEPIGYYAVKKDENNEIVRDSFGVPVADDIPKTLSEPEYGYFGK